MLNAPRLDSVGRVENDSDRSRDRGADEAVRRDPNDPAALTAQVRSGEAGQPVSEALSALAALTPPSASLPSVNRALTRRSWR